MSKIDEAKLALADAYMRRRQATRAAKGTPADSPERRHLERVRRQLHSRVTRLERLIAREALRDPLEGVTGLARFLPQRPPA